MPSGQNGPYQDPETPVRNNAHWAMIFIKAYELKPNNKYLNAAVRCVNYLKSMITEGTPVFYCRSKLGKDNTNGLIGQAWAIEPFMAIQKFSKDKQLQDVGINVIKKHFFDEKKSLWKVCDQFGNPTKFDHTFNHQLWFAAVSSFYGEHDHDIDDTINQFMNGIEKNLILRSNGRIGQAIFINSLDSYIKPLVKKFIRKEQTNYMKLKEVGYHAFNTYAFIMLHKNYPNHKFWEGIKFKQIIKYLNSKEYKSEIYKSKYGFAYNPPSYEVFATSLYFRDIYQIEEKFISELWSHQIKLSWDKDLKIMSEGSFDKNTHIARSYECALCC
jgi:hypothetical protein